MPQVVLDSSPSNLPCSMYGGEAKGEFNIRSGFA